MEEGIGATVEDEIRDTRVSAPHVILLGAGASRAAFPKGDANGRALPLMGDFSKHVPVKPILEAAGLGDMENFEEAYEKIATDDKQHEVRSKLEKTIYQYFSQLALPSGPTLYDHLVLSVRPKDVIATFNWDPFLIQAVRRNALLRGQMPRLLFLHGNVLLGYCRKDGIQGTTGTPCSKCQNPFPAGQLLFPIKTKNYHKDPMIAKNWEALEGALNRCFMFSIFGYGAPTSDTAAMDLMRTAWGDSTERPMEQFEFINTQSEEELLEKWKGFVHTHHYEHHMDFYDSWISKHPRRTGEAFHNQYIEAKFIEDNPLPRKADFEALWKWFEPLMGNESRQ